MGSILLASCGGVSPDTPGIASDWAGHSQIPGFNGDGKDTRDSLLYFPLDVEFAPDGTPWVLDWNNHLVRKVVDGKFQTVVGNFVGDGDGTSDDWTAPGIPGTTCSLNHPTDLQFRPDGTLILDSWHNHKIRNVADGNEYVLAGRGYGFAGDGGPFASALLNQPKAIQLAPDGTLYILDQKNQRIRKVANDANHTITTVVGTGTAGYAGDGGDPLQAKLNFESGDAPQPSGALAMDSQGRLYISDGLNSRIRRVDFTANTITTIAGTGVSGYSGDNGPAAQAQLNNPRDLEFGPDGRLYIADTENHRIRAMDLTTGIITTVAGTGVAGAGKELQPATKMALNRPFGIAFDKAGALYISDTLNNRIVRVAP
jgi:sugar lactone lactonase YvrE